MSWLVVAQLGSMDEANASYKNWYFEIYYYQ